MYLKTIRDRESAEDDESLGPYSRTARERFVDEGVLRGWEEGIYEGYEEGLDDFEDGLSEDWEEA